jgi:FkbM family methyltransferase
MKLKSLYWTLGFRPKPRIYGTRRLSFELSRLGNVEFEKWLHPKDYFQPFSQELVDSLSQYIRPGDSVIDIGAHSGDFSLPLALAAGATGVVFAWEPNPFVFAVLSKNARLNRDKTNIIPHQAAISGNNEELIFNYSDPGYCNGGLFEGIGRWKHAHPFPLRVQGRSLTEWLTRNYPERIARIRFIKIDTEGNELSVLKSMEPLIQKQRPTLHLEMYRHLDQPSRLELYRFLKDYGYEPHRTDDGYGVTPIQTLTDGDLMRWEHFDFIAIPPKETSQRRAA